MIFIKFIVIYVIVCGILSVLCALPELVSVKQKNKYSKNNDFYFFDYLDMSDPKPTSIPVKKNFINNTDYPTSSLVKAPFFLSKAKKETLLSQIPDDNDDIEFREDLAIIQEEMALREALDNNIANYINNQ